MTILVAPLGPQEPADTTLTRPSPSPSPVLAPDGSPAEERVDCGVSGTEDVSGKMSTGTEALV